MGNNAATGHALASVGVIQGAPAFQRALEIAMRQHGIEPWDPKARLGERLERQQRLGKISPFRYLNVKDGLAFFARHAGGWVTTLTRERFVQLSLEFFRSRCMHISTEDAKLFYDVFDSIDLYGDAKLSPGELASGLSSFFAGDCSEQTEAVCRAMNYSGDPRLTRAALKDLVQPYVWAMVPDNAELLRPMFAQFVCDELWAEISFQPNRSYIEAQELTKWVRFSQPMAAHEKMAVRQPRPESPLYASTIIDRSSATMKAALVVAYRAYQDKMQLREYGQQTWQAGHPGESQRVADVGVYRALETASPGLWSSLSTQASVGSEAFRQLSLWPSRSRSGTEASDASDASDEPDSPCLPPPPAPAPAAEQAPLPTLLPRQRLQR